MTTKSQHELDLDGIDLTGRTEYGGITFHALGDGSTLGNPQPVDRSIASALLDGSVVVTDRHDNREPRFQVQVEAADSVLLDAAQAMLFRACGKKTTFGWKPSDGFSERRIYRVITSHIERRFSDLEELPGRKTVRRTYSLQLICHPWAYATESTTVVAVAEPPETPQEEDLADGSSATGWSSPTTAVAQPVVESGAIKVAPREPVPPFGHWARVNEATLALSAVDFSATEYVTMDLQPARNSMEFCPVPENVVAAEHGQTDYGHDSQSPYAWFAAYVDGNKLPIHHYVALGGRAYRVTWLCTDAAASSLRIIAGTDVRTWPDYEGGAPTDANSGFTIKNVKRSNVAPGQASTGKQSLLTYEYGGSARTTASIEVSHPTKGLGEVVIYSSPDLGRQGYEPSCKDFMETGGHTIVDDDEAVSGSWVRCGDSQPGVWNIPAARLPQGAYAVRVRMRWRIAGGVSDTAGGVVTTTVASVVNGQTFFTTELPVKPTLLEATPRHNYGTEDTAVTRAAQPPLPITTLGSVTLPPNEVASDDPTAFVRITLDSNNLGDDSFEVDDLWIYYLGDGSDYSHVFAGVETPIVGQVNGDRDPVLGSVHNYLFIDQPNPTNTKPRLYVGTQADRSDAFNPGWPTIKAFGEHPVLPGANRFHVIITGEAAYPTVKRTITEANF